MLVQRSGLAAAIAQLLGRGPQLRQLALRERFAAPGTLSPLLLIFFVVHFQLEQFGFELEHLLFQRGDPLLLFGERFEPGGVPPQGFVDAQLLDLAAQMPPLAPQPPGATLVLRYLGG